MLLNDDRDIVSSAVAWATANPGLAMPDSPEWSAYFGKGPDPTPIILRNWRGSQKLTHVAPQLIPFIIAVNLGVPTEDIGKVIKHHKISTHHLKEVGYETNGDFHLVEGKPRVSREDLDLIFLKACDTDPELKDRIDMARIHYSHESSISLALLSTNNKENWLCEWLDSPIEVRRQKARQWHIHGIRDLDLFKRKHWPDGDFEKLLIRCGAFHDSVIRCNQNLYSSNEQGFWAKMVYDKSFTLSTEEIFEYFINLTKPLTSDSSESMVRALRSIETYTTCSTEYKLIASLAKAAEHNNSLDKLPIELLIAISTSEGHVEKFGSEYLEHAHDGVYAKLASAPHLFLKNAAMQFMEIPLSELDWPEQRALWKIPRMGMPKQDLSGLDLQALLTRVFVAGRALSDADDYRQIITTGQIELVRCLVPDLALPAEYLQNLHQDDLEVIVRAGAAPEMRDQLSLSGKAGAFRDELGI